MNVIKFRSRKGRGSRVFVLIKKKATKTTWRRGPAPKGGQCPGGGGGKWDGHRRGGSHVIGGGKREGLPVLVPGVQRGGQANRVKTRIRTCRWSKGIGLKTTRRFERTPEKPEGNARKSGPKRKYGETRKKEGKG